MSVKTVKATINGQTYELVYNEQTGRYEKTLTAPVKSSYTINDGHYYNVLIAAEDDAGNITTADAEDANLGESLQLRVKETVKPVIVITSPGAGATITNSKPTITFTITDDDSGVNPDSIKLTIGSQVITGNAIKKTAIEGGYECTYTCTTVLGDGLNTIYVDASDFDENAADQTSVEFTVDTTPPVLNVTSPAAGLITNTNVATVIGITNDETSAPVTVKITVNGTDQGNITVSTDGSFSKEISLASGLNTIVVTATDAAGKQTVVERTVTLDTGAPIIHNVTLTPNPVDAGATFIISVEVTD